MAANDSPPGPPVNVGEVYKLPHACSEWEATANKLSQKLNSWDELAGFLWMCHSHSHRDVALTNRPSNYKPLIAGLKSAVDWMNVKFPDFDFMGKVLPAIQAWAYPFFL